jgi:hypothetical protein
LTSATAAAVMGRAGLDDDPLPVMLAHSSATWDL